MFASVTLSLVMLFGIQSQDDIYRQDYAAVSQIQGLNDPAQQADQYLDFLTKRPDSRMVEQVAKYFTEALNKLTQAKSWAKVLDASDKWLQKRPNDKGPILFAMNAAQESGNWQKAAAYGEQAYASDSDKSIAFSLATAYAQLKNSAKLKIYGDIAVKEFPIQQSWSIAYELAAQNVREKNFDKAADYASSILKGFGNDRPGEVQPSQWNTMRAFLMETVGRSAFERRQYPQAFEQYSNAIRVNPRSDEAFYYIGQSQWKQQKLDEAMSAFAKAAVLNGGYSARSKQILEEIYKSTHAGQLAGLDQYLERARRELAGAR